MTDHNRSLLFAIFGKVFNDTDVQSLHTVCHALTAIGARCLLLRQTVQHFSTADVACDVVDSFDDAALAGVDFALSIGGDGTFLRTVEQVVGHDIPVIGINTGRLGFLADARIEHIDSLLADIQQGAYTLATRTMIMASTEQQPITDSPYALNDIAILKHDDASMLTIHAWLDGNALVTYQADGLVICTPTGSTAYSLSNGGPIVMPQADVLCLTPIAPHSLNMRPLIVPHRSRITLQVESRTHSFLTAIDGRPVKCNDAHQLIIQRAPHDIQIVKTDDRTYLATLQKKMMWGVDNRNDNHD